MLAKDRPERIELLSPIPSEASARVAGLKGITDSGATGRVENADAVEADGLNCAVECGGGAVEAGGKLDSRVGCVLRTVVFSADLARSNGGGAGSSNDEGMNALIRLSRRPRTVPARLCAGGAC